MDGAKLKKVYILIPLVYLLASFSFLFFYLSARSPSNGEKHNVFSLSGDTLKKLDGKSASLTSADIESGGFSFTFNDKTPLKITTAGGKERTLSLRKYQAANGHLDLVFDDNFLIRFEAVPGQTERLKISFELSSGIKPEKIILPLSGKNINFIPVIPAVSCAGNGKTGLLCLSKNSSWDKAASRLLVSTALTPLTLETIKPDLDPVRYWLSGDSVPATEGEYQAALTDFFDKCFSGLKGSRYSEEKKNWQLDSFEEASLIAFAAEAMRRGVYSDYFEMITSIAEENRRDLGIAAACYIGDIRQSYREHARIMKNRRRTYSRRLADNDLSVFAEKDIREVMLDSGSAEFNTEALTALQSGFDTYQPDLASLTGILEIIAVADQISGIRSSDLQAWLTHIEGFLFPLLLRQDSVLRFTGKVSSLLTVRTGQALIDTGRLLQNSLYISVGRDLVMSVLAGADNNGMVPAWPGNKESGAREIPEKLYLYIAKAYLPHHQFLNGIDVLCIAENVELSNTDEGFDIRFKLKKDYTEQIIINGLPPFESMHMYGQKWNAYSHFQNYAVGGWYYDEDGVLFLKILHKGDTEKIRIISGAPESGPETSE
ncbi:MAG: hypothetical protein JW874_03300 [Spirochaetales bacterium]|nr:hypothetical protein [Spirochaetales bacterium]